MTDQQKTTDVSGVGSNDLLGVPRDLVADIAEYFGQDEWTFTPDRRAEIHAKLVAVLKANGCWLCGRPEPDTTMTVECETPGGAPCSPKAVRVHLGCLMDMDA